MSYSLGEPFRDPRGTPFLGYSNNLVQCLLCGTAMMLLKNLDEHLNGKRHNENFNNIPFLRYCINAVQCLLCDTGVMGLGQLGQHLNGRIHNQNLGQYYNIRTIYTSQRAEHVKELQSRVSSLGLQTWRCEIESLLLTYLQCDPEGESITLLLLDHGRSLLILNKAKEVLKKYELMERLSLLELAVWKASLTSDGFFSTMEHLHVYWTLDRNFNPVAYANRGRVTSSITAIIQGVLPFLE